MNKVPNVRVPMQFGMNQPYASHCLHLLAANDKERHLFFTYLSFAQILSFNLLRPQSYIRWR